jgi:hypothetical protein
MTRAQLLTKLTGLSFVSGLVGTPTLIETKPNGDKWYMQNVREVVGNVCTYRNIDFYVVDEGAGNELAYYKEQFPISIVRDEHKANLEKLIIEKEFELKLASLGITKPPK